MTKTGSPQRTASLVIGYNESFRRRKHKMLREIVTPQTQDYTLKIPLEYLKLE